MFCLLAVLAPGLCSGLQARGEKGPPPYELLRSDEDWSYLRDSGRRMELFDPVKFIPLDEEGAAYLTLGGEARGRYEYFHHPDWGAGPERDASFLQRTLIHGDLHAGPNVRAFAHLKSGLEYGLEGGARPSDEDRLDLHELFAEGRLTFSDHDSLALRLGRQEMQYGASRLVSPREGSNVRRSFDAARVRLRLSEREVDAFVSRPVETDPGVFDDGPEEDEGFWGLYAVAPPGFFFRMTGDLYYLGLYREDAEFDQGIAHEVRHSVGAHLYREFGPVGTDFEFVYQFGRFGRGDIRAWTSASDTGCTFGGVPGKPRIGLKIGVASGDRHPSDPDLGTFNALFPKGSYFSETGLIGPANLFDLRPALSLEPAQAVTVSVDWDFFWRHTTRDGLYGPSLNLSRTGQANDERYVGSQLSFSLEWEIQRHVTAALFYAHFFAGPFLEKTPPGEDVDFFGAWTTFKF